MGLTILDAGILVAVLDPADAHHGGCVQALRDAQDRRDSLVIPASAYAECLVWPFRAGVVEMERMDAFIDALPARVEAADRPVARRAAELRARHGPALKLPDALVIATALTLDADRILTTDRDWPETGVVVNVVD